MQKRFPGPLSAMLVIIGAVAVLTACAVPPPTPVSTARATATNSEQALTVRTIQKKIEEARVHQVPTTPVARPTEVSLAEIAGGPSAEQSALLAKLRPQGEAPELANEVWLNSGPLKLADLRGQVVIVEFWTYG